MSQNFFRRATVCLATLALLCQERLTFAVRLSEDAAVDDGLVVSSSNSSLLEGADDGERFLPAGVMLGVQSIMMLNAGVETISNVYKAIQMHRQKKHIGEDFHKAFLQSTLVTLEEASKAGQDDELAEQLIASDSFQALESAFQVSERIGEACSEQATRLHEGDPMKAEVTAAADKLRSFATDLEAIVLQMQRSLCPGLGSKVMEEVKKAASAARLWHSIKHKERPFMKATYEQTAFWERADRDDKIFRRYTLDDSDSAKTGEIDEYHFRVQCAGSDIGRTCPSSSNTHDNEGGPGAAQGTSSEDLMARIDAAVLRAEMYLSAIDDLDCEPVEFDHCSKALFLCIPELRHLFG
eukprot:TRINITY_DN22538_c0_g1_i2.p1 TRINITY_DN22538_c0_g1~~TRINITY_DN22538_c0_g1_i2.p1  ORF type:complete len:353 (-),score=89.01 TRINITY_DN22538_c0_g1_i2:635-1693(-)